MRVTSLNYSNFSEAIKTLRVDSNVAEANVARSGMSVMKHITQYLEDS